MDYSASTADAPRRLQEVTGQADFAARALAAIQSVCTAQDEAAVLDALSATAKALGAEMAVFASFIRNQDSKESFRFVCDCDPTWCLEYQRQGWYTQDAWFSYASTNSEPTSANNIPLRNKPQKLARELAAKHGAVSAYIVPAPSGSGLSRVGVLMLGSAQPNYFESPATAPVKLLARSLAMELHEWWVRRVRNEILTTQRITQEDLALLTLERRGLSTKEICEVLRISPGSADSRFQRLSAKLNAPNRRATARLAAEYGLI